MRAHSLIPKAELRFIIQDIEDGQAASGELGPALREWRKVQGLTLVALAKKLGVSLYRLSDVEGGRRSLNPQRLKKLLKLVEKEGLK